MDNTVNSNSSSIGAFLDDGVRRLYREDPDLARLLEADHSRQSETLYLVASAGGTDSTVMACEGSPIVNITAEGYPGARYHAGCQFVDGVEQLAIDRAKAVFGAQYANVQPHCASFANQIVIHSLLLPGDTILGMALSSGGHLSHGSAANISGRLFNCFQYGVEDDGGVDFKQVHQIACQVHPKLIICGGSSYTKEIDFKRFRDIADAANAYLLADVTQIAGLIAARLHASPIDVAHFTTMCTFKQLYGPRGGLILSGKDHNLISDDQKNTLSERVQSALFPLVQGSPMTNNIAGKARAFHRLLQPEFRELAQKIVRNAKAIASALASRGFRVVGDGTENHIVMLDLSGSVSGYNAEKALEECGIVTNKNAIPNDKQSPRITSGLRLGTNTVSLREMGEEQMEGIADLISTVLANTKQINAKSYTVDAHTKKMVRERVKRLCREFPLPYQAD